MDSNQSDVRPPAPIRPVSVLINALHAKTGGGRTYLRHMAPRLAALEGLEVTVLLHRSQAALIDELRGRVAIETVDYADGFLRRLIWEQLSLPTRAKRLGADVVFSPANFGPLRVERSVILLRNALDVAKIERRPGKRLYWWALGLMTRASLKRAKRSIAVSAYAAGALMRKSSEEARRRLRLVHHGVDPLFSPAPVPREPFLLFVGDLYVQKNLEPLIEAFAGLVSAGRPEDLWIAGSAVDQAYAQDMRNLVAERGMENRVRFLGQVEPPALADLYRRCRLFVFPSLVETFGNPLVEAMACGAAVAASRAAAMPEILGGAGRLFNPKDARDMANVIGNLLDDEAALADYRAKSLKRAAFFSWDACAERTAEVLRAAARDEP
ncbi:MAG: glycosyltransferase family 4 protein [Rhodospirillales bacterium]